MSKKADGNVKLALKTFLRTILSTVLCLFMFFSMSIITQGILGENVGYRLYDGEGNLLVEHTYAEGEEELKKEDLASDQYMEQIRVVPKGVQIGADIVTQLMMLVVVGAFPYGMMWALGDRDSNGVRFHRQTYQPTRGLLIGTLANIPYFILYILLFVAKMGGISPAYLVLYRLLNLPFMPYINIVLTNTIELASISVWQLLALLPVVLVVPAVCGGAYILGYKQISLRERATYANIGKGNADTEI